MGRATSPTTCFRVDADITSPAQVSGGAIPSAALPDNEAVMARDSSALLGLVLGRPTCLDRVSLFMPGGTDIYDSQWKLTDARRPARHRHGVPEAEPVPRHVDL